MKRKMIKRFSVLGSIIAALLIVLGCSSSFYFSAKATSSSGGSSSSSSAKENEKPDDRQPPEKPDGEKPDGEPGEGEKKVKINYNGATVFSEDATDENKSYSSNTTLQNAILVSGGNVIIKNPNVIKSGATTSENADFYGTNAAILAYGEANLEISGGSINTKAQHANGLFSYGPSVVTISDATIYTSAANSGAIMVAGGGTLTATNITATTDGDSSAPIRSDRGGGTMTVNGGTFTSNGVGSPAVYSTANVSVNDATLVSTKSEGVVVEGANSVSLKNVTLTDTNNTLNGNSETYKNIFIYQSMSGDAEEGAGVFSAADSTLVTNNGDDFFITNTKAEINLSNTIITHNSTGAFLRVQSGKWGSSGENGGQVTLNASDEEFYGDIVLDNISTIEINLTEGSYYRGTLNGGNTAKSATIHLSKESVFVLEGDSYIESLTNADESNANIYSNGHKLYVGGSEISVNTGTPPEGKVGKTGVVPEDDEKKEGDKESKQDDMKIWLIAGGIGAAVILAVAIAVIIRKKHHRTPPMTGAAVGPAPTQPTPPQSPYPPQPPYPPQSPYPPQPPMA